MKQWPSSLKKLIQHFGRLPGIGPKMAERIVLYLQTRPEKDILEFAETLRASISGIKNCKQCFTLSDKDVCDICRDSSRDSSLLMITGDPVSLLNIERSGKYRGNYFILGGVLSPLEGVNAEKLRVKELMKRVESSNLKEIILSFNATVEGEATVLYLKSLIKKNTPAVAISRLARGIPVGGELSYADEVTLGDAVTGRQSL